MFIETLLTIAKRWKQSKCPLVDEWINKMLSIHTMEYYSDIKRNKLLIQVKTWMKLENMKETRHRKTNMVTIPPIHGT